LQEQRLELAGDGAADFLASWRSRCRPLKSSVLGVSMCGVVMAAAFSV